MNKNNLFPVFLKLETLRLLIVGAGNVGAEKLTSVISNAPKTRIKIVARDVKESVSRLIEGRLNITLFRREFKGSDLNDVDLVISAVADHGTSLIIKKEAHKRNILINVADTPDLCDFYLGSIVQKGSLKIAISTNGLSPTAAKRLKEMLQYALPEEIDEMITNLHEIRNKLKGDFQNKVDKMNEITRNLIA